MTIIRGADPFGLQLKEAVKEHLLSRGHACLDLGGTADHSRPYYEIAHDLARKVNSGECERGILVCDTGMGMAIVANKHPNVYAAVCEDPSSATKARSINNANVLTMGGMVTAPYKAIEIVDAFLKLHSKADGIVRSKIFSIVPSPRSNESSHKNLLIPNPVTNKNQGDAMRECEASSCERPSKHMGIACRGLDGS